MKRLSFLAMFIAMVLSASAQYHMHLWIDGVKISYPVLNLDSITFTDEAIEEPEEPTEPFVGVFSVSPTKYVTFSPGNLQYHPANDEWRFAEHQWDYVGEANSNIAADYAGWLDLFGWGTGDCPTKASEDYTDYPTFVDWGTNKIGNDAPNTWRTLTMEEFAYIRYTRDNAAELIGIAQVNGVNGVILLPDNWSLPDGIVFKAGGHTEESSEAYALYQAFDSEQWSKMEALGAVFIPASGWRKGKNVGGVESCGCWWHSTSVIGNQGVLCTGGISIYSTGIVELCSTRAEAAYSVRLVKDLEEENIDPEQPGEGGEEPGEPDPGTPDTPEEPTQVVGVFSVAEGKTVTFSPGNLQYHPANDEWQFAANQTDYIGDANANISSTYNGWIDLFGWSTPANNFGVSTSTDYYDYSGSFVDWGTNKIGNDAPNVWRTLTYDEWNYLLEYRNNASSLCGVAQVNGVNGLILLPDNWTCPAGVIFKSGFYSSYGAEYYAAYQTFTADQWSKLEKSGAVFLPAAGRRLGTNVSYVQILGGYWSATEYNGDDPYYLYLCSSWETMGYFSRDYGHSVRLVKDLEEETTDPETPEIPIPNPDIVNGVGVFSVSASRTVTFSPGNLQYHPKNDVWRFAEHQSISLDSANLNIAPDYDGWLDLFGWSGSTGPAYGVSSSLGDIYTGYFVDWGTNVIGNHAPNTWRTLSIYEWEYILFERDNASSLHFGAIVNGKHGRVLLPDNWEEIKPSNLELKDEYTINQWAKLETLGAVFLPAGGDRTGDFQLMNYQNWGSYWTSTTESYDCIWAYDIGVSSYSIILNYDQHILRRTGLSVRLVKDIVNPDISENGHEYVDLGLSVKWATCNIGANSPEEYGNYFAWGEVEPKEVYDWSTYKWCNGSENTQTKYCTDSNYGTVDNKTVLESADDAATANWGGSWRMPTDAELTELREQCTWTRVTQNGVKGYKVTSKKSGYTNKSIFLPAAGNRLDGSLRDPVTYGFYWSSSLSTGNPDSAWYVSFTTDGSAVGRYDYYRNFGFSVRPVCQ